ncbi:class I SAM-dependent methyltransferase [Streptomyces sp. NPDC097619]|uniref:class I SAM-dependent methyltransferase n=1 Tax=Streptomyces sp. NPDC097619 TaxID=3157228 RepID=UPI00331A6144
MSAHGHDHGTDHAAPGPGGGHDHGRSHGSEGHGQGPHDRGRHGPDAGGQGGPAGHAHGHAHDHGTGTEIDWARMAAQLETNAELHLPALRDTAARLRTLLDGHPVRRVLDVGSGPGVMTCVLAEAFPEAEAVAVDATPALLDRALARAERLDLGGRVSVLKAELPEGFAPDPVTGAPGLGGADLIWSSKAVHHLGDQQGAVTALAGLLRPGGALALAEGGLPMRFLPRDIGLGRPGLQSRLDTVQEHWYEVMRGELPGSVRVVEDWPAMLGRAGLTGATAFSTLLDVPAPLDPAARAFLRGHLGRMREVMESTLEADDAATLDVLLDEADPRGILGRPDAFLLSATTVFAALRPAA